jgi:hypothetical protein
MVWAHAPDGLAGRILALPDASRVRRFIRIEVPDLSGRRAKLN